MSGKSEIAKMLGASVVGLLIGAGVYGFAERAHAKQKAAEPVVHVALVKPLPELPAAPAKEPEAEPKAEHAAAEPSPPADPQAAALEKVREQLRSGDAAAARQALKRMRKPRNPALAQERELLTIETQVALGQLPAAKRAAKLFARAHPNSPQLPNLEKLLLPQ